jgi:hypothetical protein
MPAATLDKPFQVTLSINSAEWKVVEGVRNQFVTGVVDSKTKQPKITKAGVQQVRKAAGDDIVSAVVSTVLLHATEEVLAELAEVAVTKTSKTGAEAKYQSSDFIKAIFSARPLPAGAGAPIDPTKLTDEQLEAQEKALAAEKKRREAAKKAGAGTKEVAAV